MIKFFKTTQEKQTEKLSREIIKLNKAIQDPSINSEALKAFTETFKRTTKVVITVADMAKEMKQSNHEARHKCSACGDWFDRKKDESFVRTNAKIVIKEN